MGEFLFGGIDEKTQIIAIRRICCDLADLESRAASQESSPKYGPIDPVTPHIVAQFRQE